MWVSASDERVLGGGTGVRGGNVEVEKSQR